MACAPASVKTFGYFTEAEFGKVFDYVNLPSDEVFLSPLAHGGKNVRFPHKIFVGPNSETRYAYVKNSVAHVVTDEYVVDGEAHYIVEKWNIKRHRKL